jgi:Ca-activated chloride channel family protein
MTQLRAAALACIVTAALTFSACTQGRRAGTWYRLESLPERPPSGFNTESYDHRTDNPFLVARDNPISTFSVDVDTASYANVRRFLEGGQLPPPDAVRIEEMVNYFRYRDPEPTGDHPLALATEVGPCPWQPGNRLVRVSLKARALPAGQVPPRNLTFLIDVSGSMSDHNKLPLLQRALPLLIDQLGEQDRVAIVVYAGTEGVVLPPTSGADKHRIGRAIANLDSGGSTNGAAGIRLAYDLAARSLIPGAINRVVLATDGDFNVGVTSPGDLVRLIEQERERGIFLTVLGFGMGNYKDGTLESLADRGNGNYAYIDSLDEARKVLVEEASGTLVTVAKDVKVQVELNPTAVASYRLVGYENRLLRREEFADDRADAGDMGAGQTVTALYELVPVRGAPAPAAPLRYQQSAALSAAAGLGELLSVQIRYKTREAPESRLFAAEVRDDGRSLAATTTDFRFAAAVASFGMVLRDSPHRGNASYALVGQLAQGARTGDVPAEGRAHRLEFARLVDTAQRLGEKGRSTRP